MAAVLDALASHVMKMIMDMGEEEIHMLLGISDEINKLQGNVGPLQNLLTDAERRRITDKSVQAWVLKLKNTMYEATDILDLCQFEAMDRQEKQHWSCLCSLDRALRKKLPFLGCLRDKLKGILFCVQNPGFANNVAGRIKNLNQELDSIRDGATKYNFINLAPYDREEQERRRPTSSSRREHAQLVESDLVGDQVKKNTEELVQKLTADHGTVVKVEVVGIVGQGGIGKSTLAKKVLASEAIKDKFKIKIWLSVTQHFAKVDLLRAAISQATGGKHLGEKNDDETMLVQALTDALSKKKFLLVLDDVWNQEAWERVLRVPVLNAGVQQPGSRILVTTRNDDVVRSMGASILRVNILDDEDAWCLLKKQLPSNSSAGVESNFHELRDIGMKIVKKCDGLPLAIKVMGGLLSTRLPNEREWDIVLHKNLGWKEDGPQDELNYSVRLSYDDLSPELKQCFLYYSLFPKGSGFIEDTVISMWISEGFVQHDGRSEFDQLDLEQIGADYHRELVARNLLESDDSTDNIWDYTLHDVVRSFAQFMAKEEAFVVHKDKGDIRNLPPENQKFHRISIFASKLELTILEKQEKVRTLLLIGCKIKPDCSLANFASLRVLDIRSEESDWLTDSLCELRHLRYLSFSNTNISKLPGDIHKMRFLQHIELDNCTKLEKLPNSIIKLGCLRCLSLYGSSVDVIPRGFSRLTNLRSLYGFPVKTDGDWCTLEELEGLSHLRILSIHSLENVPGSSVAKRANISNKKSLEYLQLNCYKDEKEKEDEVRQIGVEQQLRIEVVFDELCPPPLLKTLRISGYFGIRLANWLQSPAATTFKCLKSIDLMHITHCARLPDGLCRIHGLEELLISHAPAIDHVGPEFQTLARGEVGVAFPNLRRLQLLGLSGCEEWEWEEEQSKDIAMPALEFLLLKDCTKLVHLPPGLASDRRQNLRIMELESLTLLEYVENFPSVVELSVYYCPELKRISGLVKLRTLDICDCPKMKLLEGVPVLDWTTSSWIGVGDNGRLPDQMPVVQSRPRDLKPKMSCRQSSLKTICRL